MSNVQTIARSQALINTVQGSGSLAANTIDVYFAPYGYSFYDTIDYTYTDSEGWLPYETQQFIEAFELIEAVVNIDFNIVNSASGAEMIMVLDVDELGLYGPLGYFYAPVTQNYTAPLHGVFNAQLWDSYAGGDLEVGGYGFVTMVHELMHGLGLAHPHDNGMGSLIMDGVSTPFGDYGDYDFNQGVYTAMTYNSGNDGPGGIPGHLGGPGGQWGYEAGPMALDIAALQAIYGANMSHNTGNNTYVLPDANVSGTYWSSIWDAGGRDTMSYSGSKDVTMDLRAATLDKEEGGLGWLSSALGIAGGFTIANGVVIENAITGSGNDFFTGNTAANSYLAGAGHDTAWSGNGNDTLNGEDGNDIMYGQNGHDSMIGGAGDDRLFGASGDDTLYGDDGADWLLSGVGIDLLYGGAGDDRLEGGGWRDTLYGEDGDDRLLAGRGLDYVEGGEGNDSIAGGRDQDTIYGGNGDDTIEGGGWADTLYGEAGEDYITGGNGNDRMFGGDDNDFLGGGTGNDRMFGGSGRDFLVGEAGNDMLDGGDDNDQLVGSSGNDTYTGGAGADMFVFVTDGDYDVVTDFEVGIDELHFEAGLWGGATTGQQLIDLYADDSTADVVFDFGDGTTVTIQNIADADSLASSLFSFL